MLTSYLSAAALTARSNSDTSSSTCASRSVSEPAFNTKARLKDIGEVPSAPADGFWLLRKDW